MAREPRAVTALFGSGSSGAVEGVLLGNAPHNMHAWLLDQSRLLVIMVRVLITVSLIQKTPSVVTITHTTARYQPSCASLSYRLLLSIALDACANHEGG